MQLEKITAVVRPRRPWEAVDLGFLMTRRFWGPVIRAWMMIVLPFYVLVAAALFAEPRWAFLVVWWLKPLYDRVPLYVLSRALFGSVPRPAEVRGRMPKLWLTGSFAALTWGRFDPMRSFLMPVRQLEFLKGSAGRQRRGVLQRGGGDVAASSSFTMACLTFELGLMVALVGLLEMMRPESMELSFWAIFSFLGEAATPLWYYILAMTLYFVAMSVIEPFYVGGGFALYLNRRTDLEGWDVELAFRRLAQRLEAGEPPRKASVKAAKRRSKPRRSTVSAAVLVLAAMSLLTVLLPVSPAAAQEERDPQAVAEEVLRDPVFGSQETVQRWKPRFESRGASGDLSFLESLIGLLGTIVEVLMWIGVTVTVLFLALAIWRRVTAPPSRDDEELPDDGPQVIAGLDISARALPADIVAEALRQWQAGCPDLALSFLYRGALARLVERDQLPAEESWTEEDCLRHLRGDLPRGAPLLEYFGHLTGTWQRTAYAHRPPEEEEVHQLATAWSQHFGAPA